MFGVVTPGFMANLMQVKEFASGRLCRREAVLRTVRADAALVRRQLDRCIRTSPGSQTADEKCYLFHRNAIGHAVNKADIQSPVGYDEEQDYSFARATVYMGSKLLQNAGIVQMRHDGSAFVLS